MRIKKSKCGKNWEDLQKNHKAKFYPYVLFKSEFSKLFTIWILTKLNALFPLCHAMWFFYCKICLANEHLFFKLGYASRLLENPI